MNTQPDLLQRQAAEFKGAINLLVSEECFLRDRKLLRRAVHHKACATHEPLKMPGIGYSCKPTFGPNRENSQFFLFQAKPTPKTKRLETKGLIGTARWTKPRSPLESVTTEATIEATKSFRINKRWLRIKFIRSQ